jgi:WD40 repeat protein/uncharacterized caspase-like protein
MTRLAGRWLVLVCVVACLARASAHSTGQTPALPDRAREIPELLVQSSHSEVMTSLVFSPDGRYLATAARDGTVKIWDLRINRLVRSLTVSQYWVHSVRFSPDSATLATGAGDNAVTVWDVRTGQRRTMLTSHTRMVTQVVFSPSGAALASVAAGSSKVVLSDPRTGALLTEIGPADGMIRGVMFLDGQRLLTAATREVYDRISPITTSFASWNIATGASLQTATIPSTVLDSTYSSPGQQTMGLLTARYEGNRGRYLTQVWDAAAWTMRESPFAPSAYAAPDPAQSDACIQRVRANVPGSKPAIITRPFPPVAFTAAGDRMAVAVENGMLHVVACRGGTDVNLATSFDSVREVAFAPDGSSLAVGLRSGGLRRLDLVRGELDSWRGTQLGSIHSLQFARAGDRLMAGSGDVSVWNLTRAERVTDPETKQDVDGSMFESVEWRREVNPPAVPNAPRDLRITGYPRPPRLITASAIAPAGDVVAYGGYPPFVSVWSVAAGSENVFADAAAQVRGAVSAIEFSSDSRFIMVGNEFGEVRVWSRADRSWSSVTRAHERQIDVIAASPASPSEYLTAARDGSLARRAIGTDAALLTIKAHTAPVLAAAYTPDGKRIVSGSGDGELALWNANDLTRIRSTRAHPSAVNSVAISPDGRVAATGGEDGAVMFWNADTLEPLATAVLFEEREWLVFTPDGYFDGTPTAWRRVPFRFPSDPDTLYEPEQFFNAFFEPGVLATVIRSRGNMSAVLAREKSPRAALDIGALRRSKLPRVELSGSANAPVAARTARIAVTVTDTGSGIQDLRVFRNRSLVYAVSGRLVPQRGSSFTASVDITLPAGTNEISAYAFNGQNLRSQEVRVSVPGPQAPIAGKTFIIGVGINGYREMQPLRYAKPDITAALETIASAAQKPPQSAGLVTVPLVDDAATAVNLHAVLDRLRNPAPGALAAGLPSQARELRPAGPEDAIILYFAGHGLVEGDRYYLLTHEYTTARSAQAQADARVGAVSDRTLEELFRGIDASRILIVLDSCFSGKVLDAEDPRRGPWNARGFAQLAYEKGMYVLAAAQAYEQAVELSSLGHGLLTFVLVKEGLEKLSADRRPQNGEITTVEWLEYAVAAIARARTSGDPASTPRGVERTKRLRWQSARIFYPREAAENPWVIARQR